MSMPKARMRSMRGTYNIQLPPENTIATKHTHFYHGSKCPVLTSEFGKCNNDCLDACVFHGPNCKVGLCVACWIYEYKHTETHFMPTLPRKHKYKPQLKLKSNGWRNKL